MTKKLAVILALFFALAGCDSMKMAEEKAKEFCAKEGKQSYVLDRQMQGGYPVVRSACIDPARLVHIENPFGVDAYADIDVRGATILKANSDSIAAKAGIKFNDVIQEFDGSAIATANDLQAAVASVPAGKRVPIKLHRSQQEVSTTAQF